MYVLYVRSKMICAMNTKQNAEEEPSRGLNK